MKSIDLDWMKSWLRETPLRLIQERPLKLVYGRALPNSLTVKTDSRVPSDFILLANRLTIVDADEEEKDNAPGGADSYVFWVRERGIWDEITETIGDDAFRALLRGYDQDEHTRGILIGASEATSAKVLLLTVLTFQWDAYFTPSSANFLCHVSHHGYLEIWAPDEALFRRILKRLSGWNAEVKSLSAPH